MNCCIGKMEGGMLALVGPIKSYIYGENFYAGDSPLRKETP